MAHILCFGGQGAKWSHNYTELMQASDAQRIVAQRIVEVASDVAHTDISKLLALDEAVASQSIMEQGLEQVVAITIQQLVFAQTLKAPNVTQAAPNTPTSRGTNTAGAPLLAGFSLGELSAFAADQLIGSPLFGRPEELFEIALLRSRIAMTAFEKIEAEEGPSTMAAIIGPSADAVDAALAPFDRLWCANYNGARQTVISGLEAQVQAAEPALKAAGARRIIPLKVRGAYHSPLMQEARDEFYHALQSYEFGTPSDWLMSCISGDFLKANATYRKDPRAALADLFIKPVLWTRLMNSWMTMNSNIELTEISTDETLIGLWKAHQKTVQKTSTITAPEATMSKQGEI